MSNIQQLTENLWINSSELFTYHSGIFVSQGRAAIIDPGLSQSEIESVAQFVRAQNWDVLAVILTHGHWDHVLGADAFPNARVITQQVYLTSPRNDPNVIQRIIVKTPDLGRTAPFTMPVPRETFDASMTLNLGELTLELYHTPGHAPDHLFVLDRASGTVWSADMLSDEEIPFVIDNLTMFEHTLETLHPEDFRFLVACHGTPTADTGEIRARIKNDRAYLSELRQRVGAAVSAGSGLDQTLDVCAGIPYRQPPQDNRGAHRRNVESAYVELGGIIDPTSVGWQRAWLDFAS